MKTKKQAYGNDSISALKGADRVRKRPAVIFGSDGLEGCEHAVFEILSNAIDEAREGHGDTVIVTRYADHSIEVEDFGRGCPVDWNETEQKYNWELVFCELYAGGKYQNNAGGDYEYSLGLNGLGACATQYASKWFDAVIHRDGFEYKLHFEEGEIAGEMEKTPYSGKKTGSTPDGRKRNAGIGLSVCATIIRAHGGEISAENRPGGGALFRFTLGKEDITDDE